MGILSIWPSPRTAEDRLEHRWVLLFGERSCYSHGCVLSGVYPPTLPFHRLSDDEPVDWAVYLFFRDTQLDSGRTVRPRLGPLCPLCHPRDPGTIVPRLSTCIAKRQRTSAVDLSWFVIPSFFRGGNSAATIAKAEGSLFAMATCWIPCQVSHATHRVFFGIVGLQLPMPRPAKRGRFSAWRRNRGITAFMRTPHAWRPAKLLQAEKKDGCCAQTVRRCLLMPLWSQCETMGDLQDPLIWRYCTILYHISGHILWWYSLT